MKKLLAALACLGATLALAGTAAAGLGVGVNDDAGKYEEELSWFYPTMASTGMQVNALTLRWDEYQPEKVADQERINQAISRARASGIKIELNIFPLRSQVFTGGAKCSPSSDPEACGNTARIQQFASWAAEVARTFPSVREFAVMNECNQPLFVNPQWNTAGQNQSAVICGRALVAAYDALKAVHPGNHVWGVGLSPRGNDRPEAASNSSTSPVTFIGALGAWFKAFAQKTGRRAPLMDGFDFHPYPIPQSQPFAKGYEDPNSASIANLPRIYQAFYNAFSGSPQRTIGQHRGGGLKVSLNETGVQTGSAGKWAYSGFEVSATSAGGVTGEFASEEFQASWYVQMLNAVACDPNVEVVNIFHLVDETSLAGWQSGLYFADQMPKKSAQLVKDWIQKTGGNCQGSLKLWKPESTVATKPATDLKAQSKANAKAVVKAKPVGKAKPVAKAAAAKAKAAQALKAKAKAKAKAAKEKAAEGKANSKSKGKTDPKPDDSTFTGKPDPETDSSKSKGNPEPPFDDGSKVPGEPEEKVPGEPEEEMALPGVE